MHRGDLRRRAELKLEPRREQHGPFAERRAEAHPTNSDRAVVIELYRDGVGCGGGAKTDGRNEVILQPAANPEEGEVVALLHLEAQLAEKTEGGFRILLLAKLPAEIQQTVHLVASDATSIGQQFVDDVQGTPPVAVRRGALGAAVKRRALVRVGESRRVQFLR